MGQMSLPSANYQLLVELNILSKDGKLREYSRLKTPGFMDLVLEPLPHMNSVTEEDAIFFSLAHYFKQNGDLCQDPDMVLMAYPDKQEVHAYSFQQAIPPVYKCSFDENGRERSLVKNQLNSFLNTWLITGIRDKFADCNWEAA